MDSTSPWQRIKVEKNIPAGIYIRPGDSRLGYELVNSGRAKTEEKQESPSSIGFVSIDKAGRHREKGNKNQGGYS